MTFDAMLGLARLKQVLAIIDFNMDNSSEVRFRTFQDAPAC